MSLLNLKSLLTSEKKIVFFLSGIGGIGISAIAEILHSKGFTVIGSDLSSNSNTARLEQKGIKVYSKQQASNISENNIDFVVKSSAVKDDHPEIIEARKQNIQVLTRANILSAILELNKSVIISGTHGKTTTTSLIGHIAANSVINASVISGGIMNNYASNVVINNSDWIVAEADESDGCFKELSSKLSVITNIEPEHMDYFQTEANLRKCFLQYINNVPDDGANVICFDDPICRELIDSSSANNIISYGFNDMANVYAYDVKQSEAITTFKVASNTDKVSFDKDFQFSLPMIGHFNVLNALASIIVCKILEIDNFTIQKEMLSFKGVNRRLTYVGEASQIKIYDDYAHHPTEINATLSAVQNNKSLANTKVIAVFQPHRYSRVKDHYNGFIEALNIADKILVTDIFSAGEKPILGISKEKLCEDINNQGVIKCQSVGKIDNLAEYVKANANDGDLVICLGAGDITKYANLLPKQLAKIL
jgi:UDP-N-acetylmuramate--alanine ligase